MLRALSVAVVLLFFPTPVVASALIAGPGAPAIDVAPATSTVLVDGARWWLPTNGAIVDFFRPPAHNYGPGNRGLEFKVYSGSAVSAVADGTVSFAGQVGPDFHVVVDHDDGLRSGYSHLESTAVNHGDLVIAGSEIGRTSDRFHLSARLAPGADDHRMRPWGARRYVDPLPLLGLELYVRLT